jgi:hypothetical protein
MNVAEVQTKQKKRGKKGKGMNKYKKVQEN